MAVIGLVHAVDNLAVLLYLEQAAAAVAFQLLSVAEGQLSRAVAADKRLVFELQFYRAAVPRSALRAFNQNAFEGDVIRLFGLMAGREVEKSSQARTSSAF